MTQMVSDKDFAAEVLESAQPVVVDFYAEWCPPCKAMAPALEQVATELAGKVKVVKLDVDQNPQITQKYRIQAMPTLMVFKGGKMAAQHVGALVRHADDAEGAERGPGARREDAHDEEEEHGRAAEGEQGEHPRLPRVRAGAQRVRHGQDVDEDRQAMQAAPPLRADAVAQPVRQAEHRRLLDYVRRYRRDPVTAPLLRQAQTLRDDPVFAAAERTFATLPGFIAYCNALPRDFGSLRRFLVEQIYRHGSMHEPLDLVERATGAPLSVRPLASYLEKKYTALYDL